MGVDVERQSRGDISDHEAFAVLGVPSVFMWRPDNPAWHQPTDTVVDLDLLIEDVVVVRIDTDGKVLVPFQKAAIEDVLTADGSSAS